MSERQLPRICPYGCTYPYCKERCVGEPFVPWCKSQHSDCWQTPAKSLKDNEQ